MRRPAAAARLPGSSGDTGSLARPPGYGPRDPFLWTETRPPRRVVIRPRTRGPRPRALRRVPQRHRNRPGARPGLRPIEAAARCPGSGQARTSIAKPDLQSIHHSVPGEAGGARCARAPLYRSAGRGLRRQSWVIVSTARASAARSPVARSFAMGWWRGAGFGRPFPLSRRPRGGNSRVIESLGFYLRTPLTVNDRLRLLLQ